MDGLSVLFPGNFSEFIAPVRQYADSRYWFIDSPAGIVGGTYIDNPEIYDEALVHAHSKTPSAMTLSVPLFKPYCVDALASFFPGGEWSLYIGIVAESSEEALHDARMIDKPKRYGKRFFEILMEKSMLMILNIAGGRWEVYCRECAILEHLEKAFNARFIDSLDEGVEHME